ncbi:porin [Alsobacter sp. R-9]
MRITSLLLGSAAAISAVAGASAADLPSKKAAPVEYVRVCSIGDVTGFVIPGTDTCLKIAGRIRAEYYYNQPFSRNDNTTSTRARGYLTLDSMTNTDWGPVRATTRVYVTKDSGSSATPTLDWAYLQFAGITAGRIATSFFEFAPFGGISFAGGDTLGRGSDLGSVNTLAYTAAFGDFAATISLEDGTERRVGLQNVGINYLAVSTPTYGGNVMPDIVGRLEYNPTWGQVALTGAIHQSRVGAGSSGAGANVTPAATILDTTYGFAVQGGVKVNLPMLAPGDAIFLQAAYSDGANSYTGWTSTTAGTLAPSTWDVVYDAAGNAKTSNAWSVTGGLLHYWTPTIRQGLFAAYGALDQYGPYYDTAAFSAGSNVIWSPVKNLEIGAEVVYSKLTDVPLSLLPVGPGNSRDNWAGRIRFERDF